jgi:hypothetical protein
MRHVLVATVLAACGSSVPVFPSDDVAAFDASFDQTVSDSTFGDVTFDVAPDAPKFGGGGPFLCNGCVCDGTLNLCAHFSGGPAPMPIAADAGDAGDFGDASACDFDAGDTACAPIPVECLPNPSCACVMQHYQSGACTCDIDSPDSGLAGNGLVVSCNFP